MSLSNSAPPPQRDVSLVILAAGLGSRFGGDKQLAGLGPANMPLMYYNLMDAHTAGIRHAVLILRPELVDVIERDFLPGLPADMEIDLVIQSLDDLPATCETVARAKPWGTGHALWCARHHVPGAFITVNADDYYGPEAIRTLVGHFQSTSNWALTCYTLVSTLSPHGGVNRGLCTLRDGYLLGIEECLQIHPREDTILGKLGSEQRELPEETPVSMNLWGFTPDLFEQLGQGMQVFLECYDQDPTAEFLLPEQVLVSINTGRAQVRAYLTCERWLGITYPEDLAVVDAALTARSKE